MTHQSVFLRAAAEVVKQRPRQSNKQSSLLSAEKAREMMMTVHYLDGKLSFPWVSRAAHCCSTKISRPRLDFDRMWVIGK
jgi:hypothetical protein